MKNALFDERKYHLWVLVRQARDAMLRARKKELSRYGISARQSAVLIVSQEIGEEPTVGEISRWLMREPHSVSAILTRMEKVGLVKKIRDPVKRSIVRVTLTKKGKQAYQSAIKRETIQKVVPDIPPEQYGQFTSLLEFLRDKAIEELGIHEKPPFPPRGD